MLLKARKFFCSSLFISLILVLDLFEVYSQNYYLKTFTTKDGLPHNNIKSIAEDTTGFLWVGTWDGLSRYDGHEFKNYHHIPGDTNSISYFSIKNLIVDKANNLWILTDRGEIDLYDRINDNFRKITDFSSNDLGQIFKLNIDDSGDLWIITANGLIKRNLKTGKYIHFKIFFENDKPFSDSFSYSYSLDFQGNKIWLVGSKVYELEIKSVDEIQGKIMIKQIFNIEGALLPSEFNIELKSNPSLYESPTGNLWIFSNIGLFKLDKSKGTFNQFNGSIDEHEFSGNRAFDWALNGRGLYSYNPETHTTSIINSSGNNLINTFHHKKKKLLWFSSISNSGTPVGLTQVVFTNSFFKNYSIGNEKDELEAVFSIAKDYKDNIWVGVRGRDHILQFNRNSEIRKIGQLGNQLFKLSDHIRSMIPVKDGIWIGYYSKLLRFYDYKSGQFIRHFAAENSFRTMTVNKEGRLLIGTNNLSLYYPESGKTERIWSDSSNQIFYKLLLDDKGILWAGKNLSMLLKYNTINKESKVFSISTDNYHIEDVCVGENNELWLATLGEGLCNFNPETGKIVYYTTSSGMSNNTTYCILIDNSGNLWVSTDSGISKLNPHTGNIKIYDNTDGLEIAEFNSDASYIAEDGEFFFGGMGGFVGFYPDSLVEKNEVVEIPRILITNLTVSGAKKTLPKSLTDSDTIILLRGENNFHLSFSSTDFLSSDKTLFRYKLEKINNGWVETNSRNRNVNYSNLKPGRYLFEIQATNSNGDWTGSKKIVFQLKPYFYQTKIFLITTPIFIVIIVIGVIIIFIRQLKQREKLKQDALKLQSLRGQMNPHFIFNCLNSINYFISNNDKLSANRYIADFSRLIRSILTNLGSDYIPFPNELNSIKDYLNIEHLRFGDKFDFQLNADSISDNSDLEIFPGLVQPFIENAIWHGVRALETRKGFIKINFSYNSLNSIRCSVEDDGIGRSASHERRTNHTNHKSSGTSIVIERLQLISKLQGVNYRLEISDLYPDRKDTGTRVEIDIPSKLIKQILND